MICWCRFIFLLHYSSLSLTTELPLLGFHCWIIPVGLSISPLNYSSWSLTTELPLLDFHCWIIPVGLSPLNHSSWSFTVELPLLLNYPNGLSHLNYPYWSFITEWFDASVVCSKGKKRFGTPSLQRMALRLEWQIPHKLPFLSLDNLCKEGQTYGL